MKYCMEGIFGVHQKMAEATWRDPLVKIFFNFFFCSKSDKVRGFRRDGVFLPFKAA